MLKQIKMSKDLDDHMITKTRMKTCQEVSCLHLKRYFGL